MNRPTGEHSPLRMRAEAKIAAHGAPAESLVDPARLLHELHVHKIELKLQNEELMSANRELDVLRRHYVTLYQHAPVGYLTLSLGGVVLGANRRAFEMLKREADALVGAPLRQCFDVDSVTAFDALVASAAEVGDDVVADNLLVHRPRSVPIYVKAQSRKVDFADLQPPVILLALMDVSALKFAIDDVISKIPRAG